MRLFSVWYCRYVWQRFTPQWLQLKVVFGVWWDGFQQPCFPQWTQDLFHIVNWTAWWPGRFSSATVLSTEENLRFCPSYCLRPENQSANQLVKGVIRLRISACTTQETHLDVRWCNPPPPSPPIAVDTDHHISLYNQKCSTTQMGNNTGWGLARLVTLIKPRRPLLALSGEDKKEPHRGGWHGGWKGLRQCHMGRTEGDLDRGRLWIGESLVSRSLLVFGWHFMDHICGGLNQTTEAQELQVYL